MIKRRETIGGVAILSIIVILFIVYASYPNVEIKYYTKHFYGLPYEWAYTDFNITGDFNNAREICFRFTNIGEPLLQYVIPASNFEVFINSDANCENCESWTSFGALEAQKNVDACRSIRLTSDISNFTMSVSDKWQALLIGHSIQANYLCRKTDERGSLFTYFCQKF